MFRDTIKCWLDVNSVFCGGIKDRMHEAGIMLSDTQFSRLKVYGFRFSHCTNSFLWVSWVFVYKVKHRQENI